MVPGYLGECAYGGDGFWGISDTDQTIEILLLWRDNVRGENMKASDLPEDSKRMLLNGIRSQIDSSEYNRMADAIGEDGIIDIILGNVNTTPKRDSSWRKAGRLFGSIMWRWEWIWVFPSMLASSGWAGFATILGILSLFYFSSVFFYWIGELGATNG